jgi:pimeloyl-ACP methyl ester carboxylesterase
VTLITGHADLDHVMMHFGAGGPAGATPVVFLHGWPDLWFTWEPQMETLAARGYSVLAPDQRGYGRTTKPPHVADYQMEHLVGDVVQLCERLGLERIHLVGHDWGGEVAWALALERPELLRSLTIVNAPHPYVFVRKLRRPAQALRSWYMLAFQVPGLAEAVLGARDAALQTRLLARGAGIDDPGLIDRYRQQWRNPGAVRMPLYWYRALFRSMLRGQLRFPEPPRPIEVPTMIIWGRHDPVFTPDSGDASARLCLDAEVHRFDTGHWPQVQAADAFTQRLVAFVEAHSPAHP